MAEHVTQKIHIEDFKTLHVLFGNLDEHIKRIESRIGVHISSRDGAIIIKGPQIAVQHAEDVIHLLASSIKAGESIDTHKIQYAIDSVASGEKSNLEDLSKAFICLSSRGKAIRPKTLGQNQYIQAIQKHDVVFGVGPAGTGKTYLAVAMAIRAFKNNDINRIIITRPAVEAGENLGFLPGDLQMKVDPYLRPIYDAMYDILGAENYASYKERGLIEIAPLAYMRGRTLDNAYIILDEAQNTTREQMKMFLTRFGFGSKVIINGDVSQIDLPKGRKSGLIHALDVLKDIPEIKVVQFNEKDVVRHSLVKKIILSYDQYDKLQEEKRHEKKSE